MTSKASSALWTTALLPAFCWGVACADTRDAAALIADAQRLDLASDPTWRKLGHYKVPDLAPFSLKSDVISDRFFLAADGAENPHRELVATIEALSAPVGTDPDAHAQCLFPARFAWLKQSLAWEPAQTAACGAFQDWMGERQITSLSFILASGYLGNPSSYYGHILLRFNSDEARDAEGLYDTSLNYGAAYPDNENGLLYIAKGLTGHYRSTFTTLDYFQHDTRYTEDQLRDVWEYELSLSQNDVDMVVAHAWELMGAYNRYFFLRQNCAFRMAELVDLVLDRSIVPENKLWALPADVFEAASMRDHEGKDLIRRVARHPSRQTRFRENYFTLSPQERAIVGLMIADHAAGMAEIAKRDPAARARILETLIDYYSYLESGEEGATAEVKRAKTDVMVARLRMPPREAPPPQPDTRAPHDGQKTSMAQVALVAHAEQGAAVDLRFRGAYYDFLTLSAGTLPFSELSMVDVTARIDEDGEVALRRAEIARITTLSISGTGLPNDGRAMAWRVRFGAEHADLACESCIVGYAEGAAGRGFRVGDSAAAYGFLMGRATTEDERGVNLQVGPAAGVVFGQGEVWRAHVETGYWQALDGDGRGRPFARIEARLGAAIGWDFRLAAEVESVRDETVSEARAAFATYW